jgi:uncharacterized protein YdhG (YjbR/CyaY superfamily)
MKSKATTVDEYIKELPEDRKEAIKKLRAAFKKNLPKGFREEMSYGMIGFVVPHSIFPAGYHCNPSLPLPFVNIASQKNFIALHHMGMYANPTLLKWFIDEYPKHTITKLDMGKACIRFKKPETIPYKLLEELAAKITVDEWIECYTSAFKKK